METKSCRDYGLTEEHFLELVDFYCELFRLDEKVEGRKLRRRKQELLVVLNHRPASSI